MRHILLHGHIFKNAGSTLDWSLRRCFGSGFCEHRDDAAMREAPRDALAAGVANSSIVALSSHNLPSPPPSIDGIAFYTVFLLRHPIERALSVYAFERQQQATTPGAQAAKRMNLQDYVAWRLQDEVRPVIRNFQTRFLAGGAVRHGSEPLTSDAVAAAHQRLKAGAPVGLVERYDASMMVLEAALRPFFPQLDLAYLPQNVSRGVGPAAVANIAGSAREQLGPLWEPLLAHNAHDLALYAAAGKALDRRIATLPDVGRDLEQFRQRLAALRQQA
ncbi:hypothetical protein [Chromatocurvus halotolerans]|uniref:Sulfotransferase family protein n=1 Tax=Chromatocurvus halotolerans TaxID=1132028 RepID=A0A4R2KQB4_9GAMM|nr:hypothetical protein [Chromatocurvus halotolerans]TCO74892.1 hypothetical protein EV688_11149 [Chromatocurvus halotolerans]